MGLLHTLTRSISTPAIAVHFDSEVVRLMQVSGYKDALILQNAFEVSRNDDYGLKEAISSFRGHRCVLCVPSNDVLVQHIKVGSDASIDEIRNKLVLQDHQWAHAEIRTLCVSTTGSGATGTIKQELLCMGIDESITRKHVETLETAGGVVDSVTVPVYASIRSFDKLYRRDGDEKITSMLIEFDDHASMIMIAHGQNCVFAHQIGVSPIMQEHEWKSPEVLQQVTPISEDEFERRGEDDPRGLCGIPSKQEPMDSQLKHELTRCLQHHDALFPQRAIDRVIFSGVSASDTDTCASIASELGIPGYVADPSAWIEGDNESVRGPAWTTVAGTCLRYAQEAA